MEFFYYYSLSLFDFRPLTCLDVNFFFDFFSPKKNLAANFFRGILSFLSYIYHCWLKSYVSKLADWEKSCNHISILAHFCSKEIRIYIYICIYNQHNILDITYWHQLQVEHDTSSFRLSLETILQSWLCRRLISNKQPLCQTTPDTGHHKVILQYIWLKVEIIKVLTF